MGGGPRPGAQCSAAAARPGELLADHAQDLDEAWRHVADELGATGAVSVDAEGRLHAAALDAIADPPSLTALRQRCEAMLPKVDIGELLLEVMSWHPGPPTSTTAAVTPSARPASPAWKADTRRRIWHRNNRNEP